MTNIYGLLESILKEIENGLYECTNSETLAEKFKMSSTHLSLLFRKAFRQSIGSYIRSRKLASSVEDLLNTNLNILDIALDYGFEHEQSYIRSFKREYGLTPGEFRKTGKIISIKPPLNLFNASEINDGVLLVPEIVMIPEFHVVGKKHKVAFRDVLTKNPKLSADFDLNKRLNIPNSINPKIYFNINIGTGNDDDYFYHMPAVQVKSFKNIPKDFDQFTFPNTLCVRFCFIGPKFSELNTAVADDLFKAIDNFMNDDNQKYFIERKRLNIERFDLSNNDENFCIWEWYAPVKTKTNEEKQKIPADILNIYKQETPNFLFVGKKYEETLTDFYYDKILEVLDDLRLKEYFDPIENQHNKYLFNGVDSYICLLRKKSNKIEYCFGLLLPENSIVSQDFYKLDFQKSSLFVCRVYGKRNHIINFDTVCKDRLSKECNFKINENDEEWHFLRFNWHRFFEEDKFGNRILEYCYFEK